MAQVVESLLSKHVVLNLIPCTVRKGEEEGEREEKYVLCSFGSQTSATLLVFFIFSQPFLALTSTGGQQVNCVTSQMCNFRIASVDSKARLLGFEYSSTIH
jgi:hypothetical protein